MDEKQVREAGSILRLAERTFSTIDGHEWDEFVQASGGSFLGSWALLKACRIFREVKLFELFVESSSCAELKVGQCAVRLSGTKMVLLDRLYVRPEWGGLRYKFFDLVVQRLLVTSCHYGSRWNVEDRFEIDKIPGFVAENLVYDEFHIDVINFKDWPDFQSYARRISENVRRDYKKARMTAARVGTKRGLSALGSLLRLATLRREVMRKHKVPFRFLADCVQHAAKLVVFGNKAFITTVRVGRKCYSAFFGIEFGGALYYISGGTQKTREGFGSLLFLSLIEDWFAKNPNGTFVMGFCSGRRDQSTYTTGALLYRRKLRVLSMNGVEFQLKVRHEKHERTLEQPPFIGLICA